MVSMMAGADFIKTSTGKETVNATLEVGLVMCRAIRKFYQITGFKVSNPYNLCITVRVKKFGLMNMTIRSFMFTLNSL